MAYKKRKKPERQAQRNYPTPVEQADGEGDITVIKILPRNLTARADYLVEGNPATSRPESGVDISYPGLELDQRNLDQRFFPGLYFEYSRLDGAVLTKLELTEEQRVSGLTRADLSPERPLFLLGVFGRSRVGDKDPVFISFNLKFGIYVWQSVRDLLPGRVAIIFGPSWSDATSIAPTFKALVDELAAAYHTKSAAHKFVVHRDESSGLLKYAVFSDKRSTYLDDYGVIDPEAFPPGELTKTLCAPWIYDFRDCICFYWASNKPDIADAGGGNYLNFLRPRDGGEPPKPTADYQEWIGQRMSHAKLTSGGWKELPIVLNDREEQVLPRRIKPSTVDAFGELEAVFTPEDIVNELKYLATVEHALIVEYLYAHYSLNAPARLPKDVKAGDDTAQLYAMARDIMAVARDEMSHFLWVNNLLRLFGCPSPVTDRAEVIGLTPPKDSKRKRIPGFQYLNLRFGLRPLSPKVLDGFIKIEANSRAAGTPRKRFGMYVNILASLMKAKSKIPNSESIIRIIKLLIDEGDGHGAVFTSIKERLAAVKRPHLRKLRSGDGDYGETERPLLDLADEYYRQLLVLIQVSYQLGDLAGGALIFEAVKFMRSLDDIGHKLAGKKIGLRFTMPNLQGLRRTLKAQGAAEVLRECERRINSKLMEISKTDAPGPRQMAERHLALSKAVHKKMIRIVGADQERWSRR